MHPTNVTHILSLYRQHSRRQTLTTSLTRRPHRTPPLPRPRCRPLPSPPTVLSSPKMQPSCPLRHRRPLGTVSPGGFVGRLIHKNHLVLLHHSRSISGVALIGLVAPYDISDYSVQSHPAASFSSSPITASKMSYGSPSSSLSTIRFPLTSRTAH